MASDGDCVIRRQHWQEFSEGEVLLLRGLRNELSSRRWEIMLEIDVIQGLLKRVTSKAEDHKLQGSLAQAADMLDHVHRALARIPEDVIPAF